MPVLVEFWALGGNYVWLSQNIIKFPGFLLFSFSLSFSFFGIGIGYFPEKQAWQNLSGDEPIALNSPLKDK